MKAKQIIVYSNFRAKNAKYSKKIYQCLLICFYLENVFIQKSAGTIKTK